MLVRQIAYENDLLNVYLALYIFNFFRDKPMLILYETSNIDELKHYKNNQVKAVSVKPKSMFGHHHT